MKKDKSDDRTVSKKESRGDCFLDRRSGEDRRMSYSLEYFKMGKLCRRRSMERRFNKERRAGCVRISEWSSACPVPGDKEQRDGRIELDKP